MIEELFNLIAEYILYQIRGIRRFTHILYLYYNVLALCITLSLPKGHFALGKAKFITSTVYFKSFLTKSKIHEVL